MKALIYVLFAGLLQATVPNILTITEATGSAQTNYPVQIARPFLSGEIAAYPQAGVCSDSTCATVSTWLTTQADVKQRYVGGSVKHAIISFLLPSLSGNAIAYLTFRNQATGNNTAVTLASMLADYDFDATMQLTATGITKTVSARTLLGGLGSIAPCSNSNREPCLWTSGSVATTVILADHVTRAWDTGFEQDKITTVAADWTTGSTSFTLADATGWTTGTSRLKNETIQICGVVGNVISVGVASCPNADGRALYNSTLTSGTGASSTPIYHDGLWKTPSDAAHKSFRPIFMLTFWPGISKVKVRFVGENSDVTKAGDQIYSLVLTTGSASPATVYTSSGLKFGDTLVRHVHGTRWTKEFWIGGAPASINIDHNLAYLAATLFIYNFDIRFKGGITGTTISDEVTDLATRNTDLYGEGFYADNVYMPEGGGTNRGELGPYPRWQVRWLYTGDSREFAISRTMANLSGAWPVHHREGDSTRKYDLANSISAMGKAISTRARPTLTSESNYQGDDAFGQLSGDRFTYVGATTQFRWYPDVPHTNDSMTLLYMLTGDYYYLEEAWFFGSFTNFWGVGNACDVGYGRGPLAGGVCGRYAAYVGETRGYARGGQQLVQTALVTPDGYDEKSYYDAAIRETIAVEEGSKLLASPHSSDSYAALYAYGQSYRQHYHDYQSGVADSPSPLGIWNWGGPNDDPNWCLWSGGGDTDPLARNNTTKVDSCIDMWEQLLLVKGWGRMYELGYDTQRLLGFVGPAIIQPLTLGGGIQKYILDWYTIGGKDIATHHYFTTWASIQASMGTAYVAANSYWHALVNPDHAYPYFILGATAYLNQMGMSGGAAAYSTIFSDVSTVANPYWTEFNQNPKDAIAPRVTSPVTGPFPTHSPRGGG